MDIRMLLAVIVLCLPGFLSAQPDVRAEIESLIISSDFKGAERTALQSLPIEALPQLVEILEGAGANEHWVFTRCIGMIGIKLVQFESELSEPEKAKYASAMVAGSERAPPGRLPSYLGAMQTVKRPEFAAFAARMLNDDDIGIRRAARILHDAMGKIDEGNVETEQQPTEPSNPPPLIQSASPKIAPVTTSSAEPTSSMLGSIIVGLLVVALCLLWVVLKLR